MAEDVIHDQTGASDGIADVTPPADGGNDPNIETPPPADDQQGGIADGAGGKPGDTPPGDSGKTDGEGKPEPYELTAPEGFDVPEDNLKGFSALCNELGMTKEQAEKMLDWHKAQYEQNTAYAAQQEAQVLQGWAKDIQADPEFGGANWRGTLADARRALDRFDTDGSLREFLRETKFQHHPQVIRVVARVGRAMGEHGFVGQNGEGGQADSEMARLRRQYPSEFQK